MGMDHLLAARSGLGSNRLYQHSALSSSERGRWTGDQEGMKEATPAALVKVSPQTSETGNLKMIIFFLSLYGESSLAKSRWLTEGGPVRRTDSQRKGRRCVRPGVWFNSPISLWTLT